MQLSAYRRNRLKYAAENAGCDLVIASLPANNQYTGGYVSVGQHVLHRAQAYTLYIPSEDRLLFVNGLAEIPALVEVAGIDADIFCFGGFRFAGQENSALYGLVKQYEPKSYASAEDALIAAIQSTNCTSVALDESRISTQSWAKVADACEGVAFAPGTGVFMQARMVKHPEEIAGIARSAEIAEECLQGMLKHWKPGMSELEMEYLYNSEVCLRGATPYFFVGTADLRAAYSDVCNTDLAGKQMIRFDFGCLYGGYCSDLARTAAIGKPDEKLATYYHAVQLGTREAIAAMKPGVPVGELFDIAVQTTRANGIPHYQRHHVGHGIGLEAYDMPTVVSGETLTLRQDMTFCIETPYYELGWGGVQIENTVAVTESGARYLDKTGDALILLDA